MSKIALTPNGSGSGVFTIASPNSNTNRTITLPDESITLGAGSPSIDDNGNATAMTIDSSENVMIGTTSTDQSIAGHGFKPDGFAYHTRDGGAMLRLNRLTSDGDLMQIQKDGTTVGSIGADNGRVYIESSGGGNLAGIGFSRTAVAVEPRKNNAFSSSEVDVGSPTYKFRDAYLSGGVYLGGTAAANKLDDYEEGTFTPVVAGGSSAGTASYFTQSGSYTKVGNLVTVWIRLNYTGGNGSGSLQVKGFPFTVVTTNIPTFVVYTVGITAPSTTFPAGFCNLSDGIQLVQNQTGGNSGPTLAYDGSGEIVITGTYPTNA